MASQTPQQSRRQTPAASTAWKSINQDEIYEQDLWLGADGQDPRALSGPCKDLHAQHPIYQEHFNHRYLDVPVDLFWKANGWAKWADCQKCGLRVAYWPRKGMTGRTRIHTNRHVIQMAIDEVANSHMPPEYVDRTTVKAAIKKAEATVKLERHMTTPLPKAKAKNRPTPQNQTPQPRPRAQSSHHRDHTTNPEDDEYERIPVPRRPTSQGPYRAQGPVHHSMTDSEGV